MSNHNNAPVCGIYCGECHFLGKQCAGCGQVAGRPFWTAAMPSGVCPLHDCCRNYKQLEHCGLCEQFPCETFLKLRDPGMSDAQFHASLQARQAALKRRTAIGTENWLREVSGQ
jgi:hypothetical protein